MEGFDQIGQMLGKDINTINQVKKILQNPEAMKKVNQMMGQQMGATPKPKTVNKIGRNEKCPCESGNKYKKCCGIK